MKRTRPPALTMSRSNFFEAPAAVYSGRSRLDFFENDEATYSGFSTARIPTRPACDVCAEARDMCRRCSCEDELHWICRLCRISCLDCNMKMCPINVTECCICLVYICKRCDRGNSRPLCRSCHISCTCTGCDGLVVGEHESKCPGCPKMTSSCAEHTGGPCRNCGCRCEACGAVFARASMTQNARPDAPADGVNCWPVAAACPECQRAARAWRRLQARDALVAATPLPPELAEKVAAGLYRNPSDPQAAPNFPQ
jgi:hypothetical protein